MENNHKVTITDGGGQGSGVDSMGSYLPLVLAKAIESVKEVTGVDIREIMKAETYDAKVNNLLPEWLVLTVAKGRHAGFGFKDFCEIRRIIEAHLRTDIGN